MMCGIQVPWGAVTGSALWGNEKAWLLSFTRPMPADALIGRDIHDPVDEGTPCLASRQLAYRMTG